MTIHYRIGDRVNAYRTRNARSCWPSLVAAVIGYLALACSAHACPAHQYRGAFGWCYPEAHVSPSHCPAHQYKGAFGLCFPELPAGPSGGCPPHQYKGVFGWCYPELAGKYSFGFDSSGSSTPNQEQAECYLSCYNGISSCMRRSPHGAKGCQALLDACERGCRD